MGTIPDEYGFKTEGARRREVYAKFIEDRVTEALSTPAIRTAIAKIVDERLKAEVDAIVARSAPKHQATLGPPVDVILRAVQEATGVPTTFIMGPRKMGEASKPRLLAYWLLRSLRPDLSFPQIGHMMGGRDHSTVIKGIKNFERYRERPLIQAWIDHPAIKALLP